MSNVQCVEPAGTIARRPAAATGLALRLFGAWAVLGLLLTLRYPEAEGASSFLPSLDAAALLGLATLCGRRRRPLPRWLLAAVAVLVIIVRVYRIGDGVTRRYFARSLSFAFDLPLSGELVRLVRATVSPPLITAGLLLALALLALVAFLAVKALRMAEGALASRQGRVMFGIALAVALAASLPAGQGDRRVGAFAASAVPSLVRETAIALRLGQHRAAQSAAIAAAEDRLRRTPRGLDKLGGAPVLIFLVESYGETVVERPEHARIIEPVYRDLQAALEQHGFTAATGLLDSPTYAGRSWFAQETLFTGARVADRVADQIVQQRRPQTMARLFREAGYRTVFAQPANRYRGLSRWTYDFEVLYQGWDLGYRGPAFGFANMPDQFAVGLLHQHEVARPRGPLLVAYSLQSSHSPWNLVPPLIDDWSRLGDGSIYHQVPAERFPVTWNTMARAGGPYLRSVEYDLRMLADYAIRFVPGDTLVVILGDHQPVAEVTRWSASHAVPVHVISRSRALVAPFLARGYQPGMRPRRTAAPPAGLETFLPGLLADFSTDPLRTPAPP